MKHIGIHFDTSRPWLRDIFQGVSDYAADQDWVLEFMDSRDLQHLGKAPSLDGILCDHSLAADIPELRNIPHIWLHPNFSPHVGKDEREAGRIAARHLVERGFRSLAFFQTGDPRYPAPFAHEQGFREVAEAEGRSVQLFLHGPRTRKQGVWRLEDQFLDLADFLRQCEFPVGVMGANLNHVRRLFTVCRHERFRIPEEVAIVSPADDPVVFPHLRPGITAVAHNQRKIGCLAAETLDRRMRGEPVPDHTLVEPLGLTVRGSTDHRVMVDPLCAEVVAYIWEHLEQAPSQEDLAKHVHVTPRTLHRHFVKELGRTPTEEMLYARIETAKRLLVTTERSLVDIALSCGYSSQSAFNRHFKKETGTSPGEWRKVHAA